MNQALDYEHFRIDAVVGTAAETDIVLSHFAKPKARIDFTTLRVPSALYKEGAAAALVHAVKGRIEVPRKKWEGWFTVHDPAITDLQFLLDHYPEVEIQRLEIAVDFKLADGSNDILKLVDLHRCLKTRMYPQKHARMTKVGRRKFYDLQARQVLPDTLKTKSGTQSVYWTNSSGHEQVRLYIKTKDNGEALSQHCVRIEITLSRGGCQTAGVYRIGDMPNFAEESRRYLSRFLYVASGFKPKIKRSRSKTPAKAGRAAKTVAKERERVQRMWERYGATWAVKHDYEVIPDADANRLIGGALKGLRDDLRRLKLTQKRAEAPTYECLKPNGMLRERASKP